MRIESSLPKDRHLAGVITAYDDANAPLLGPAVAFGKADNLNAVKRHNPNRITTLPGGDHPYGVYDVVLVQFGKLPARSYGSAFLLLDPVSGDAYLAKDNGRAGLAIHGGDPAANGSLRPTEGCLRMRNDPVLELGRLVKAELAAGRKVAYTCSEPTPEPERVTGSAGTQPTEEVKP